MINILLLRGNWGRRINPPAQVFPLQYMICPRVSEDGHCCNVKINCDILLYIHTMVMCSPTAVQCERKPITISKMKSPAATPRIDHTANGYSLPSRFEAHSTAPQLNSPSDGAAPDMVDKIPSPRFSVSPSSTGQPLIHKTHGLAQVQVCTVEMCDSRSGDVLPAAPSASQSSSPAAPYIYPEGRDRWMRRESLVDLSSDVLSSEHLQFKLNPPSLAVTSISMDYIYELATRLLFLSVDWARTVPAFRKLERQDQLALLQYSWSDIFLFGVAQCSNAIPLSPLLTFAATHLKWTDDEGDVKPVVTKGSSMFEKVMMIKNFVSSLERLDVDYIEYALLRAILVFNTGMSLLLYNIDQGYSLIGHDSQPPHHNPLLIVTLFWKDWWQ